MDYPIGKNKLRKLNSQIDSDAFAAADEAGRRNIVSQLLLGHDYDESSWNKFVHPYDEEFAALCAEMNSLV